MNKSATSVKTKAFRGSAALAASLSIAGLVANAVPSATADPRSVTALVGVGSDTTQDILNALAGFNNGINYTPVQSSVAGGQKQLASWDATPSPGCITPKAPGATIDRPNGSGNGRKALSRALDGGLWGTTTCGAGGKVVSGLVDFARSSAGPSGTGTVLTYIPFGRDAVSFAYAANGVAPVTTLTSAQLQSLFSTGPQNIGGVDMIPCLPQTGSGTRQFWVTAMGVTDAVATTATAACNGTIQENDGNGLKARSDTLPNKQLVIGFSAANFIAQSNGRAPSQLGSAAGVDLGAIDALGKPYTGTAPNLAPASAFYANTTYGRDVYNVVATAKLGGLAGANLDFKSMFAGTGSAICSSAAQATVNLFGFLSIGNCGDTTLTGPSVV